MIVAFLLMSAILMMSIQTSMATEKDIMSNDVIKHAQNTVRGTYGRSAEFYYFHILYYY